MKKKIILAAPRGFCAGVDRAVEIVEKALQLYGRPLYVKHEIVHNIHVVEDFKKRGVRFIESLEQVPEKSPVIFSAHGVSPVVVAEAERRNLEIIDATCPLVTKVHLEARRFARDNFTIFLVGHANHVETIGTAGEAPGSTVIIESEEDVERLDSDQFNETAYLTQTTLSIQDTKGIIAALKKKFPAIAAPVRSDICYATTNRQQAIEKVAELSDLIIVIGSKNSSNSTRLKELAEQMGKRALLIDSAEMLDFSEIDDNVHTIGITAGASAPEHLVTSLVNIIKNEFEIEEVEELTQKEENVTFKIPKSLAGMSI